MSFFGGGSTTIRADKISNFSVNTAEFGAPVQEILGTTRISGNIIYYDDFNAIEHRKTQRAGKGGGSKTTTISYTYEVATIFALCEGPIDGIGKVWIGKEIYDYPNEKIGLTLFKGEANQAAWSYLVGKHPDKALSYPGLAYMAGSKVDLGESASMPTFNFEVKGKLLNTGDGIDVNPADYILYILDRVGMGDIAIDGIDNYRNYCRQANLLISTPSDSDKAQQAREIVNEIAQLTNAYVFWSNDRFKIVPLADRPVGSWQPNKTIAYDLTPDDFLPQSGGAMVTFARKDSSEIYNRFTVEFLNRSNGYEKESVSYEDAADILLHGVRQAPTVKAHYIYTKERAVKIAEEQARKNKYERNQYTFKLGWAFCRLEVGDLVTLTDPAIGLEKVVCCINSVTEDKNGALTITAVSRAQGDYSAAVYDVHENERPTFDFNAPAGDVDVPVIFQPPSELTVNGNELWIGAKGTNSNWGGCIVYVSDDNEYFQRLGQITNNARIGSLVSSITADATSMEVTANGEFLSASAESAERGNTLCWLNGEMLSYTTATLLSNGNYRLDGLVRGQYNTTAQAHSSGATFARCDGTLLKSNIRKEDVGKSIWLKFCSYNIFGANEQSLADVEAYEYVIADYYIPPITNLIAYNRYRQLADGISRYDIVVQWQPPNLATYLEGQVWYKTNSDQIERLGYVDGVAVEDMAFNSKWIFGGSGADEVVIPQAVVGDTYVIAVTTKDEFGMATSPDLSPQTEILVALRSNTPQTPNGFGISFTDKATAYWDEVTNTDVAFYEIRTDQNPGIDTSGLLAQTNGTSAVLTLANRNDTLYLYCRSATSKYSTPAILAYNKPAPPKPNPPNVTAKLGGMSIVAGVIPSGCNGMNVYINDVMVHTINNTLTYSCDAGVYEVKVAYTDIFGEGAISGATTVTVKITVDGELLEAESVTYEKMSAEAKQAIADSSISNINIAVQGLLGKGSALVMDGGELALVASNGEKLTGLFVNDDGVMRLEGKCIHITGDTVFDDNVIVGSALEANSVSADKLNVSVLSAISATIGTLRTATSGARTEIKDNLIEVYDENNVLRVRMGVW